MLNIYVEKEFLDDFYKEYNEDKPSKVQTIVYKMLVDYPETTLFLNYEANFMEEFEKVKMENPMIAIKSANSIAPEPITSIKEEILRQTDNKTSIVFMRKEHDWFDKAENKGVLCFSFENYEMKIRDIIDTYHYKIDLSENGFNWGKLNIISIFNQIKINDNYILVDKDNMKMDKNLIRLLRNAMGNYHRLANIEIYTKNLNPKQPGGNAQVEEAALQKSQRIKDAFVNYKDVKFKIINNSVSAVSPNFHDRMIIANFQIIDCGIGFNLIPHKASNSQIVSETIFELYSYKRLKNLASAHDIYFQKITGENFQTSEFTYV